MACASHVQYVVVEASDCQYWQMIAAMWMGRYMELVAPLCSGQWPSWAPCWQTSECNQGFCDLESNAEPPQTHGAQWGRDVTNSGATSDVPQAFAVSGLESVHEPNEKRRKTKCEDEVPCSDSGRHLSCVDDFEVALMESYMQTIFDCDFETDLQIDWSEEGWCSVNLHDMPGVLGRPWPKPSFQVGESVQLHRLKAARYNGQIGKVITELQAHGRHGVRLHNGQCISVSVSNMLCVEDTPRPSQEKKGYKMFSSDSGHHLSCVDDFDVGLMESSMRTLFDCDIETDLQIDWSRDGSCNVNLRDMLGGPGLNPFFSIGESVRLRGLKTAQYNGQSAAVITELQGRGRHRVRLENGQVISVSSSNMERVVEHESYGAALPQSPDCGSYMAKFSL